MKFVACRASQYSWSEVPKQIHPKIIEENKRYFLEIGSFEELFELMRETKDTSVIIDISGGTPKVTFYDDYIE